MIGTPSTIQWKNVTWMPVRRSSMPMPIRFGGVPTGVPMPPIEAPNDVISITTSANWRAPAAPPRARCAHIDSPMGYIIAVVAVLLIHIERSMVIPPNTSRMRVALVPTKRCGQRRVGNPLIDAVHEHRLGQDEAADEDEDHGIGERRERRADRDDPQDHREHRAEHRGDRERQRLGDPEHDHHRQDAGQFVGGAAAPAAAARSARRAASGPRNRPIVRRRLLNCSSAGE